MNARRVGDCWQGWRTAYSPDQPRDERGRWTDSAGGEGAVKAPRAMTQEQLNKAYERAATDSDFAAIEELAKANGLRVPWARDQRGPAPGELNPVRGPSGRSRPRMRNVDQDNHTGTAPDRYNYERNYDDMYGVR